MLRSKRLSMIGVRRLASQASCGVALVAILAGLAVLPNAAWARRHGPPATGLPTVAYAKAPPDFAFDFGDGQRRLAQYHGRAVVVNFWATWCGPCAAELDAFTSLQQTYGERVPLLTISAEAPGVARTFLREHHVETPAIEDPDRKIFDAYSVSTIPVTLVLGPDGTVSHVSIGQIDWPELRSAVEEVERAPADHAQADHAP